MAKILDPVVVREIYGLPDVELKSVWYSGEIKPRNLSEDHQAVVDKNTDRLFAIHSDRYGLLKHEEAISIVGNQLKEQGLEYDLSVDSYKNGGCSRAIFRLPGLALPVDKKGKDLVEPEAHVLNSYDGSSGAIVQGGAYRLICANGLVVGRTFHFARQIHVGDIETKFMMQAEKLAEAFRFQVEEWKAWQQKELGLCDLEVGIDALGAKKYQREALIEVDKLGRKKLNWWIFFNILTAIVTHRMGSIQRQIHAENQIRKVFYR